MTYRLQNRSNGTYIVWAYEPGINNRGYNFMRRTTKMYESTNQMKAWGVTEYLNNKERGLQCAHECPTVT